VGKDIKFFVGNIRDTTLAECEKRVAAIRLLYAKSSEEWGKDCWAGWALAWAKRFAQGPVKIQASETAKAHRGAAGEELIVAHKLIEWGLPITIIDPQLTASGAAYIRELVVNEMHWAAAKLTEKHERQFGTALLAEAKQPLPDDLMNLEKKTFHESLDEYKKAFLALAGVGEGGGKMKGSLHGKVSQVKYLKEHHKDFPLWQMDLTKCQEIVSYWGNRPMTKKGTPCGTDHAKRMHKFLKPYWRWLDATPKFKWNKPEKFDTINWMIKKLPTEKNGNGWNTVTVETYSIDELVELANHCDAFGKALLGVCVNCAFGASEIGQWSMGDFLFNQSHKYEKNIDYKTNPKDSWIVGFRPKSQVYGEHWIFPEVVAAVEPFIKDRAVLPIWETGEPWYRVESKNAQSQFGNWFDRLVLKVQKTKKEFRKLPFGSLRDLFPNILEREYNKEVADICLHHGNPDHDILRCYSNTPYRKVFQATKELKPMFQPFLDAIRPMCRNS
jgi:hypothetical protein